MTKRINIMSTWKEFNPTSTRSIKDDFQKDRPKHADKIIAYLGNGEISLISTSYGKDVLTGERIPGSRCVMTDGEFSWSNSLGYYVKKYNLRLPKEFEDKIIK